MAPVKQAYLEELERIRNRITTLFEQAFLPAEYDDVDGMGGVPGSWTPAVDVLETEDAYLLFAELPGVRREDIQLQVKERRLELSGRRQPLSESQNFLRLERSYGPFRRHFELAAPVDVDGIAAAFEQGTLRITVPKRAGGPTAVTVQGSEERA